MLVQKTNVQVLDILFLLSASEILGFYINSQEKHVLFKGSHNQYTILNLDKEEELQYPRDDETRKKVIELWEIYYECLEERAKVVNKPEIRRLVEGQFTELSCPICRKPFQDYNEIEWKYRTLDPEYNMTEPERLDLTSEMEFTGEKTLKIYNVVQDISGLYACYRGKSLIAVYILEISKNDTMEKVIQAFHKKVEWDFDEDESFLQYGSIIFRIYYKWSPWTECSLCGSIGRRFKYGSCYVTNKLEKSVESTKMPWISKKELRNLSNSFDLFNNFKTGDYLGNRNRSGDFLSILRNFRFSSNIKKSSIVVSPVNQENVHTLKEVVGKFKNGVPCFSSFVTSLHLDQIQLRSAMKVVVRHCRAQCPTPEIFAVIDEKGKIIDMANNTAGIYSAYQKIPKPPPDTDRRSIAADFGSEITIQCPRTMLSSIPVTWKINNKIIFPEIIGNESSGRITIDLVNRIHIKKLRLKDNHIYSCWQRNHLVGTVRLNVEKKFKVSFDHHVTLIGLVTATAILLIIGSKVLSKELNDRT